MEKPVILKLLPAFIFYCQTAIHPAKQSKSRFLKRPPKCQSLPLGQPLDILSLLVITILYYRNTSDAVNPP
jgi:hypothetical protein